MVPSIPGTRNILTVAAIFAILNILIHFLYNMVEKLNRLKVEKKLKTIGMTVFTPVEFGGIFNVSANTASMFISRNLASGLFIKLRNNYYILEDSDTPLFFIANKLYQPSYVSLEKALFYYGIIPEFVYSITSVTTKATRDFNTGLGNFSYQKIKQEAFTGYKLTSVEGQRVLLAEKEKALADYLYFVDLKQTSLNDRLNLKKINKNKLLYYVKLFNHPSLLNLVAKIYAGEKKIRRIY